VTTPSRFDAVIVGGFGHVGLPLGLVFADVGLQVGLYDIDREKRRTIEAGRMPFIERDAEPLLRRVLGETLHVVDDLAAIGRSEYVVITIGTPVDEYLNPKVRPVLALADELVPHLTAGHRIVLRSTVYPGTSKSLSDLLRRRGRDVHVAYCPERIVQGYAVRELRKLPQIISGFTPEAVASSRALFERLGVETLEVSVAEAELAKLFSNAWRYLQFAAANQFYMIATDHGVDYARVYEAMTANYGRAQDLPRPGFAAGPCLLKDTLQLAAAYRNNFLLGHAAMMVNEGLPDFVVRRLVEHDGIDLNGARVGILGMAFKADIDDIRDSLSYKLAKILRFHGATVVCSDEYVDDPAFVKKEDLLASCPIVVVGVPHAAYRGLVVPAATHLVDLWGVTAPPRGASA